jgi:uncharacterized membrane protein
MFDYLTGAYHLHPILDHFTIALLFAGTAAEFLAAAALLLPGPGTGQISKSIQILRNSSLLLMAAGAAAAVLSYFTGDSEAGRVWDSITPAAQRLLSSNGGAAQYLSHAALGYYLMYAFLILGLWRILIEVSPRLARWRAVFLVMAGIAVVALAYQGKTGGELVYEYGVGIQIPQPSRGQPGAGPAVDFGRHQHGDGLGGG